MTAGSEHKRGSDEGWAWRKRREIHSEAVRRCDYILRHEPGMTDPQLPNVTRLYTYFIQQFGRDLKIRTQSDGGAYWFAEWRNDGGEWYACILAFPGHTYQSALLDLCQVLCEIELGFRKPTRVRRQRSGSQ